jgi:hypothetical protein
MEMSLVIGLAIAIAIATAVVLIVILAARRRRHVAHADESNGLASSHAKLARSEDQEPGPQPDDLVLVPFPNDTGQALVVGPEHALAAFDRAGLSRRQTTGGSGPVPQLVRNAIAGGGLKATQTFQDGATSGRIVALAPETMEHLAKGKPVFDKSGDMLALVRGNQGKLRHVMRFDKAGAQAAAASNLATLAVTAALSQQLEAISEQLQEISETLQSMVKDKDRERLSDALAANEILFEIAESVRRRGITQGDFVQLASLRHRVTSLQIETTAKLAEIAPDDVTKMSRGKRREVLAGLYEKERLEYWLAVQVQADLARTRCDLLNLLWEHHLHPETADALNQHVAEAIRSRQTRAAEVGEALRTLSDPASQTRLDPVRLIARHRLGRAHIRIDELLLEHGPAFAGPERDPHTVTLAVLAATEPRRLQERNG